MTSVLRDLRFGWRTLSREPTFTFAAVLCLALGIGVGSSVFLFVDATLLRPLPVEQPKRLVWMSAQTPDDDGLGSFSYPDLQDLRGRNDTLAGVCGYSSITLSLRLGEHNDVVRGQAVTSNYFSLLGVRSAAGRLLLAGRDGSDQSLPEVVLSYDLWRRDFALDPSLVGRPIYLTGQPFTVVGIAPQGFHGTEYLGGSNAFWIHSRAIPYVLPKFDRFDQRGKRWIEVMGRLRPGATIEQASAAVDSLAKALAQSYPASNKNVRFVLFGSALGHPTARKHRVLISVSLLVTAALILLCTCANVASLVLARAEARSKEVGVRFALGATRARLLRQMLAESLLLFTLAGIVSLAFAFWTSKLLAVWQPLDLGPLGVDFGLNGRVVLVTFLLALVPGVLLGLAPAWRAGRLDLVSTLKTDLNASPARRRRIGVRHVLVVGQVASSLALLIGASLLIQTLHKLGTAALGFTHTETVVSTINLRAVGYDLKRAQAFYQVLQEHLHAQPAVRSAALALSTPFGSGSDSEGFYIAGQQPSLGRETISIGYDVVSPGYFATLGIPILVGRDFGPSDQETAPYLAIINKQMADRYWPGRSPIGEHLRSSEEKSRTFEIVGMVANSKIHKLADPPTPFVYLPLAQNPSLTMCAIVNAGTGMEQTVALLRHEVQALDRNLPLEDISTIGDGIRGDLLQAQVGASLLSSCGFLALLLSGIGIYGIVAYSVANRHREIGIRLALGAQASQVVRTLCLESLLLLVVGVALGVPAAAAFSRLFRDLLYGVGHLAPLTYLVAVVFLAAITLLASVLPARRALRSDVVTSLHQA